MPRLEIYYSFRSPYSYLAVDRLIAIAKDYAIDIEFRPVRPLAMREPDFFSRGRKQFLPYLMIDVAREAQRRGMPFGPPRPDPIDMDMTTGKVAADQPKMDRLMALSFAATAQGDGLAFARAVGAAIWGGCENWHDDAALGAALAGAGLDLAALSAWADDNQAEIAATLSRNEAAQLEKHWGVPLMVLDGEPFFGQDRLDALIWRLEGSGLRR